MSARFASPYRQLREHSEESLRMERTKQMTLEQELAEVQRQLSQVRAKLGHTPAPAAATAASHARSPRTPAWEATPMPQSSSSSSYHAASFNALARNLGTTAAPPPSSGIEGYYINRIHKLLGAKAQVHNMLQRPGVSVEEVFGEILQRATPTDVPWIVTDDQWTHDLHKSHFHNLLQVSSESGKKMNVNLLVLTHEERGPTDGKKDVALCAMTRYDTMRRCALLLLLLLPR
jgi:hypothetical protein